MKPRLMFGAARAAFLVVGWSGSDAAAPTKPTGERSENELYGEGYLGLLNTLEEAYGAPHHHATTPAVARNSPRRVTSGQRHGRAWFGATVRLPRSGRCPGARRTIL
jgi:hypothetical protein